MSKCFAQQNMEQDAKNKLRPIGTYAQVFLSKSRTVIQTLNYQNYRKMIVELQSHTRNI